MALQRKRALDVTDFTVDIVYIQALVWLGSCFSPISSLVGFFCNGITFVGYKVLTSKLAFIHVVRRFASNTTHYIQICFYKLTCIYMEYSIYLITIVGIHLTSSQNESLVLCIMLIVLWILFVPYIFVHVVLQTLQSEEWPPGGFSGIGIYVFMVDVGGVILYMCASWETI